MTTQYALFIGVSHATDENEFFLLEKSELDHFRLSDGVSGQDRESYSDTQDRESYSVDGSEYDDELELARGEGEQVADYAAALAAAARDGGTIVDVIALMD